MNRMGSVVVGALCASAAFGDLIDPTVLREAHRKVLAAAISNQKEETP